MSEPDDPLEAARAEIAAHRYAEAAARLEAVEEARASVRLYMLLGAARHGAGRLALALESFERAGGLDPAFAEARNASGAVLGELGRIEEARVAFASALEIDPENPRYLVNQARLIEPDEPHAALALLDRVLARDPGHRDARLARGTVLNRLGRPDAALADNEALAAANPDLAAAHLACAETELALRRFPEAEARARRALSLDSALPGALLAHGLALAALGRLDLAQAEIDRAMSLNPQLLARLGRRLGLPLEPELLDARAVYLHLGIERYRRHDWSDHPAFLARAAEIFAANGRTAPPLRDRALVFPASYLPLPPADRLRLARGVSEGIAYRVRERPSFFLAGPAEHGRIRIGYLGANTREHPNGRNSRRLYELHDRSRFEVAAYALDPDDGSETRRSIAACADRFRDLSALSDIDAAYRIYEDGIDILVDLGGYTEGSRTEVLAYTPAKVQIAWLGFHESMGADFIHYHVVDEVVCPPGSERHRCERLIYLPHTLFTFDDRSEAAANAMNRADAGLPDEGFVFAALHRGEKIEPEVFDTWTRILAAVPRSVLWLAADTPDAEANLLSAARERGVAPQRLVFAPAFAHAEHLARLPLADLFLDTRWYNAHTTALEALWMGVPVLTVRGVNLYGRIASGMLGAAGLPELIAPDLESYRERAVEIARAPARCARLRSDVARLRGGSPLFDIPSRVRSLESAYELAWARHLANEPPGEIRITR